MNMYHTMSFASLVYKMTRQLAQL